MQGRASERVGERGFAGGELGGLACGFSDFQKKIPVLLGPGGRLIFGKFESEKMADAERGILQGAAGFVEECW